MHDQTLVRVTLVRLLTSLYILVEIYINIYLAISRLVRYFVSDGGIKNSASHPPSLTRAELLGWFQCFLHKCDTNVCTCMYVYIFLNSWKTNGNLICTVERSSSVVERPTLKRDSPGSNPLCYYFEDWAFSFSPRRPSSLSCINEYPGIDSGGNGANSLRAVISISFLAHLCNKHLI